MDHSLAGSPIRLTWLQDRRALAGIDWPAIFDDLTDAGLPMCRWQWCDLDSLTHVVLALDRTTGHYAGVLGLSERAAPVAHWMMVGILLARPGDGDGTLARAMLAHALARIVCLDGKPIAVAAQGANRTALSQLCQEIRSAELHPPVDGNVIAFAAAGLARRIGVDGAVIDLRQVSEASLLRDLRGIHRVRRERTRPERPAGVMATVARSAAATRRPRKATHTGRSG
jgi:hypothetical protein